ncbi:hypothetical protein [Streptomyces sp. SUK 48]|uniref:hypothetical protein n=1 Tax=Streptomyces sp. SUK 48 TaxID=2582831 RepID=UPI00129AB11E|nr:hypothetical protein [Streptomyces sp. SUK 48]
MTGTPASPTGTPTTGAGPYRPPRFVAAHTPGGTLSVAWSGDARAYLLLDGNLRVLTDDHNERWAYDGHGDRHTLTACRGAGRNDEETQKRSGHPVVERVPSYGAAPATV